MKTKIKSFLFLLIILSIGCSKNDDEVPKETEENIRLTNYTRGLQEYEIRYNSSGKPTEIDITDSANALIIYNSDNQIIQLGNISYEYNSQNRISTITDPESEANLIYNSQGQLAEMIIYVDTGSNTYTIRKYYTYDTQGRLIEIEEKEDAYDTRDLITYDDNNNVIQIREQISTELNNYEDYWVKNYTYDDKNRPTKNVLASLSITDPFTLYLFYGLDIHNMGNYVWNRMYTYGVNNILSASITSSTYQSNTAYTYVYNEAGYPIAADEVRTNNSTATTPTVLYHHWTYETD